MTLTIVVAVVVAIAIALPAAGLDNGLGRARPAFGWSTWNHFGCNISEELIRQVADSIVSSGLRDAG
jgi:alpha-galactosidase